MALVALADFGSTYTKVNLVDSDAGRLLARAAAPTSTETDLMEGYRAALARARAELPDPAAVPQQEIAASSAGGGLRIVAVGLVADFTAAAAQQAALNAGARVGAVLAGPIGPEELDRLDAARPEIVLFAGGTDGGEAERVLENARRIAAHGLDGHVVVACNAGVADRVTAVFEAAGIATVRADNVMPRLGRLEIESARAAVSRVFLEHVIGGKGLSASPAFAAMVRMPTPQAVLNAVVLLARGLPGRPGRGDTLLVDVGGATTDVHSERALEGAAPGIEAPLLSAPLTLRTVEGDLGLRAGAPGVVDADGAWLRDRLGVGSSELGEEARERAGRPAWIATTEAGLELDRMLAVAAVAHALNRHCGTMLLSCDAAGEASLRRDGPDLRGVQQVLGTGGVFAHREDGEEILAEALERRFPRSLTPLCAEPVVDSDYLLAAAGLLASVDAEGAFMLLSNSLGKN